MAPTPGARPRGRHARVGARGTAWSTALARTRRAYRCAALTFARSLRSRPQDNLGKVMLHYAAEKQASDAVVESLLTANYEGAKAKASGNLPLHYAAQFHASDVVVDKITSANEDAAKVGAPANEEASRRSGARGQRAQSGAALPRITCPALPTHGG